MCIHNMVLGSEMDGTYNNRNTNNRFGKVGGDEW